MKTLKLSKKRAVRNLVDELERGSDFRYLVSHASGIIKFIIHSDTENVHPELYVGVNSFPLAVLVDGDCSWSGEEDNPYREVEDAERFDEKYEELRDEAKVEIEAALLDKYENDSDINPHGEDVHIIWT